MGTDLLAFVFSVLIALLAAWGTARHYQGKLDGWKASVEKELRDLEKAAERVQEALSEYQEKQEGWRHRELYPELRKMSAMCYKAIEKDEALAKDIERLTRKVFNGNH